jgi:cytochrome P450
MAIFNPFAPSYRVNPYRQLGRLQESDPLYRSDVLRAWLVTRYADCVEVLRDPVLFSSDSHNARGDLAEVIRERRESSPLGDVATVLTSDPPVHTRLRGLLNRAFTPRRVEAMRPHIEELTAELLDEALRESDGSFDLMTGLAQPLPVIVIAEMLGVSRGDRTDFRRWSDAIARTTDIIGGEEAVRGAREATEALVAYFDAVVRERRAEPRDDLMSALVHAADEGDRLTHEELLAFAVLLLVAGNETTTNLIGNGLLALAAHPDEVQRLRDDPALMPSAVEELLRFDSPVQGVVRFATADTEVAGQPIANGDSLLLMLGMANRDPRQFSDPERLDLGREENRHLAFGLNVHYCLGAPLARLEAAAVFAALLERFERFEVDVDGLERGGTFLLRGPDRVPLRVPSTLASG